MLLLFTSAPIICFIRSAEVSIAILFIFSGDFFLNSNISFSALLISSFISFSRLSFLLFISLKIFSLAWLKIFLASSLLFEITFSYSCSFASLSSLCFSAASIFSNICDFLDSKLLLIFGSISFDNNIYKTPKVNISQKICEIQN